MWSRPGWLAIAVVIGIVYGSLIPFDFAWGQTHRGGGVLGTLLAALGSPAWTVGGAGKSVLGISYAVSDLVTNLVLYLPLGVTVRMALRARRRSWLIEGLGTVAFAFSLSWGVESLQGLMHTRVASLNDVIANTSAAFVAMLVAPYLWGVYKRLSFALYCRLGSVGVVLGRWLDRPGVAMVIAGVNAVVIAAWYVMELGRSVDGSAGGRGMALPFERAFELPYDLGAVVLGQALLVYAGIGCLLLLLTYTGTRRLAMNWVVLGVVVLAFVAELSRVVTQGTAPDVTGPLLALAAGALMTVTVYTFSLAVKRSNRRRQEQAYDGPDRRKARYQYD